MNNTRSMLRFVAALTLVSLLGGVLLAFAVQLGAKASQHSTVASVSRDYQGTRVLFLRDLARNLQVNLGRSSDVSPPAWSVNGALAFVSIEADNFEIYVWDGAALHNVSQSPLANEINPQWNSANVLGFASDRDGNWEIYLWDGAALLNITQTPDHDEIIPALWLP